MKRLHPAVAAKATAALARNAILIAAIAATALSLVSTAGATFSGANGQIVFASEHAGQAEIWSMNADGTNRHNLTRLPFKNTDINSRWSPDHSKIAFASSRSGSLQLWLMNADGSNQHQLTFAGDFSNRPSWTADGKTIIFQSSRGGNLDLYRINADGSGETRLTTDPAADYVPAAAPRGNKIVFTSERDGNGHLYVMTPDGATTRITNTEGYDFGANWSPTGSDIVFARTGTGAFPDDSNLFIIHSDGSQERQLTDTPNIAESDPVFSPDGKKIAYTACDGFATPVDRRCSIHVMNVDGAGDVDMAFPPTQISLPFLDDFNDNVRNVDIWHTIYEGNGPINQEINNQVELTIPADATPRPDNTTIATHIGFHCLLPGDFDAQVDYTLLDWPPNNGAFVGMQAFFAEAAAGRADDGYTAFSGSNGNVVPTTDTSGSLRMVRSGGVLTSYYLSGGQWVPLTSGYANGTAVVALLISADASSFGHQEVKVAFDNFRMNSGQLDCSSWRPDFQPDWEAVSK